MDTSDFSPIYLYDLQSKGVTNLKKPWLHAVYYSIPLFFPKRPRVIFWSPTCVADTSSVSFIPPIGKIYIWDTLSKSVVEIKKGYEISDVSWMQLYDTTLLYIDIDHALWSLCISTGDMKRILPDITFVSDITRFKNRIVFVGKGGEECKIFVYDLETNSMDMALNCPKESLLSASINTADKFAIETAKNDQYWIFVISREGTILDSLKGNSPFWLAGTDSLVYSEGKRISIAHWHDGKLRKETILEVVR